MPGARLAPAASRAKGNEHTSKSPRSHRCHPAFPARLVLTAYSVLSPAIGRSCHRHRRKVISANLIPASRNQDHTASPSAINAFVSCVIASIASRTQRIVTIAKRPSLSGTGSRRSIAVSTCSKSGIFFAGGLDNPNHVERPGVFGLKPHAGHRRPAHDRTALRQDVPG
jgi:hypothetical protein